MIVNHFIVALAFLYCRFTALGQDFELSPANGLHFISPVLQSFASIAASPRLPQNTHFAPVYREKSRLRVSCHPLLGRFLTS
jgi:hypothetical protein